MLQVVEIGGGMQLHEKVVIDAALQCNAPLCTTRHHTKPHHATPHHTTPHHVIPDCGGGSSEVAGTLGTTMGSESSGCTLEGAPATKWHPWIPKTAVASHRTLVICANTSTVEGASSYTVDTVKQFQAAHQEMQELSTGPRQTELKSVPQSTKKKDTRRAVLQAGRSRGWWAVAAEQRREERQGRGQHRLKDC